MSSQNELDPIRALRHPIWWGALALLLLNDHVLKGAELLPGAVTGKLSDFAGLIVAPALVAALLGARSRASLGAVVAAVGGTFALVNVWPAATAACVKLVGLVGISWRMWCDPTDLMALPALGVSAWLVLRTARDARPRKVFAERALAIMGALACAATSAAPPAVPSSTQGKVIAQAHGNASVYVIDSSTGRRMAAPPFRRVGSATVEVDGVIYGVEGRSVVGISLTTDKEVMRFEYDKGGFYDSALTDGQRIFLIARGSGKNERLVAADLKTGKLVYDVAIPGRERGRTTAKQPVLAGGLIVITVGERLAAFEPGTGRQAWVLEAGSSLHWPSSEGGTVYVVNAEGTILAVDLQHGNLMWDYAVGSFDGFKASYFDGARFGVGSGVLAFLRKGRVVGVEADTRARRWRGPKVDDLVVGKEIVMVRMEIEDDDHLVALRMTDGKSLWKVNADDWSNVDPTLDDTNGLVLIRPFASELRAYTMGNGQLQWRFLLNDGARAAHLTD